MSPCLAFYVEFGAQSQVFYMCVPNTLLTELCPQLYCHVLKPLLGELKTGDEDGVALLVSEKSC